LEASSVPVLTRQGEEESTQLDVTEGIVLSYWAIVSSLCPSNFTTDSPYFGSH